MPTNKHISWLHKEVERLLGILVLISLAGLIVLLSELPVPWVAIAAGIAGVNIVLAGVTWVLNSKVQTLAQYSKQPSISQAIAPAVPYISEVSLPLIRRPKDLMLLDKAGQIAFLKSKHKDKIELWNEWATGIFVNRADLSGADLFGAYLRQVTLRGADLSGAILDEADLSGADLSGANLSGAFLFGTTLVGTNLSGAVLRGTALQQATLIGAELRGTDLRGADLSGAILDGADLFGADLSGAKLEGTRLPDGIT